MGKFNSDDHCIYYCGQKSYGNGVALIVKKKKKKRERVQNTVLE